MEGAWILYRRYEDETCSTNRNRKYPFRIIYSRLRAMPPSVSLPSGFRKILHVEWDAQAGTFNSLPGEWWAALPKGVRGRRSRGFPIAWVSNRRYQGESRQVRRPGSWLDIFDQLLLYEDVRTNFSANFDVHESYNR